MIFWRLPSVRARVGKLRSAPPQKCNLAGETCKNGVKWAKASGKRRDFAQKIHKFALFFTFFTRAAFAIFYNLSAIFPRREMLGLEANIEHLLSVKRSLRKVCNRLEADLADRLADCRIKDPKPPVERAPQWSASRPSTVTDVASLSRRHRCLGERRFLTGGPSANLLSWNLHIYLQRGNAARLTHLDL